MKLKEIVLGSLLVSLVGCSNIRPFIGNSIEFTGNIVGETMKKASIVPETISEGYGLIADSMYDSGDFIENKSKDLKKYINPNLKYKEIEEIAPRAPIDNYWDIAPLPIE